jgi:tRNA/tmRNA/rRNA uracil-C5-methylase (TrmA/RlmC/RlmD family)
MNPPRVGLHERVTMTLEREPRRPRAIVYVSCDPATLARDLARLPGYRIASIETFDMFPQTAHVETVCELVPAAS